MDLNNTHQNFELSLYLYCVNVVYSILSILVFYHILFCFFFLLFFCVFFGVATVSDKILLQLQWLGEKMDSMDRRVQRTDAALGQGSQQASSFASTSHSPSIQNCESHGIDTEETAESVVPSLGYLRNNTSIHVEVDKRLSELAQINEAATRGRMKSQRGGPGEVPVKKVVDWPQHFVLTGNRKSRPIYDDLTVTE